jgi:N-acetylglucosaminyldiphosphoundecaprenol N-acetyl-beta-D-mannosaminyltransferase
MQTFRVLDTPIGLLTMADAIDTVTQWLDSIGRCRLVTFANVHMVVEARRKPEFGRILRQTDLNCPDGSPISWIGHSLYGNRVSKISGPDFMPLFCEHTIGRGYRHFLYGGADGIGQRAADELKRRFPNIEIAGHYTPPFRQLTPQEDEDICSQIKETRADIIWVGLGCPKQEQWIVEHRDLLNARVILAVGQAFDILAGSKARAPQLFQKIGMEWAYRLVQEPRRLWKRYLVTNTLFLTWVLQGLLQSEVGLDRTSDL